MNLDENNYVYNLQKKSKKDEKTKICTVTEKAEEKINKVRLATRKKEKRKKARVEGATTWSHTTYYTIELYEIFIYAIKVYIKMILFTQLNKC